MLNLSDQSINHLFRKEMFTSFRKLKDTYSYSHDRLVKVVFILAAISLVILALTPGDQNVRAPGQLIALNPEQRPQTIQSVIAGRIEKWYVAEGQFYKGDTILRISEVKDDYFDPNLLGNTRLQIDAKEFSKLSYNQKVNALENQIKALETSLKLKVESSSKQSSAKCAQSDI